MQARQFDNNTKSPCSNQKKPYIGAEWVVLVTVKKKHMKRDDLRLMI